jgi:hypothetical protein
MLGRAVRAGEPGQVIPVLQRPADLPRAVVVGDHRPARRLRVVGRARHRDAAGLRPEVVAFAAQPLWLHWPCERGARRHSPDFFVRRVDGAGVVVDVRPDELVDHQAAEAFAATAAACQQVGWEFRRTGGPSPVLAANVRWLAGYRHPRCHRPEVAAALLEQFAEPTPLFAGTAAVGDRLVVLPVCYHLLWAPGADDRPGRCSPVAEQPGPSGGSATAVTAGNPAVLCVGDRVCFDRRSLGCRGRWPGWPTSMGRPA